MPTGPVPLRGNRSRAESILGRLADDGLRLTGQRARVVRKVADREGAFTAEALLDELRPTGIGRATVYRTLDLLESRGMLTRMHMPEGCHGYTVCDEGHHHHLVCSECGQVVPVDATGVEGEIRRLAEGLRFKVETHTLEFVGLCESCQQQQPR